MEEIEAKNDDNLVNQSIMNSNTDSSTLKTEVKYTNKKELIFLNKLISIQYLKGCCDY